MPSISAPSYVLFQANRLSSTRIIESYHYDIKTIQTRIKGDLFHTPAKLIFLPAAAYLQNFYPFSKTLNTLIQTSYKPVFETQNYRVFKRVYISSL